MLSVKGEERSKVEALDSGADDYVTKPFGIDELMARVRAALRRSGGSAGAQEPASFDAGDFRIDMDARRVHTQGREVRLTPKEFDLFVYMARHPESGADACGAARSGVGAGVAGTARVSACLHGAAAQEAGAGSVESALSRHRAVGRISIQPARIEVRTVRTVRGVREFVGLMRKRQRSRLPPIMVRPAQSFIGAKLCTPSPAQRRLFDVENACLAAARGAVGRHEADRVGQGTDGRHDRPRLRLRV